MTIILAPASLIMNLLNFRALGLGMALLTLNMSLDHSLSIYIHMDSYLKGQSIDCTSVGLAKVLSIVTFIK